MALRGQFKDAVFDINKVTSISMYIVRGLAIRASVRHGITLVAIRGAAGV
jgi:hypothetical protein